MRQFRNGDLNRLLLEEQLRTVDEYRDMLVRKKLIPDANKLPLRRFEFFLQYLGGLVLAVLVAAMGLLINFVAFNMIIHI